MAYIHKSLGKIRGEIITEFVAMFSVEAICSKGGTYVGFVLHSFSLLS